MVERADTQRNAVVELKKDLRLVNWKHFLLTGAAILGESCLITLLVLLGVRPWLKYHNPIPCGPDGEFRVHPTSYSYWGRSGFFSITLAFGSLSFGMAKFIDVAWDVAFGRGGQVVLALCSWRVFTYYVTTSMETAPITYNSFRTFFLQDGPSLVSICRLIRDFTVRDGLHSKFAMVFMVLSMIYIMCFPTAASAMTGYTGFVEAFVPEKTDGNLIQFSKLQPAFYVIHDGDRVGQTSNFVVTEQQNPLNGQPLFIRNDLVDWRSRCTYDRMNRLKSIRPDCAMAGNASQYTERYGFNSAKMESSEFLGFKLDPPVLNISLLTHYDYTLFGAVDWPNIPEKELDVRMALAWSDQVYDYDFVTAEGTCQAMGNYQWGFSFIQLFIMAVMLTLWNLGIFIMWASARNTMRKRGRSTVAGEYKAVLELAAAMQRDMSTKEDDLSNSTESTIRRRIKEARGGNISYPSPVLTDNGLGVHTWLLGRGSGLRIWAAHEKWWVLATSIVLILSSFIWLFELLLEVWLIGPLIGLACALAYGSTVRSRLLIVLFFSTLTAIPAGVLGIYWHIHDNPPLRSPIYCYSFNNYATAYCQTVMNRRRWHFGF